MERVALAQCIMTTDYIKLKSIIGASVKMQRVLEYFEIYKYGIQKYKLYCIQNWNTNNKSNIVLVYYIRYNFNYINYVSKGRDIKRNMNYDFILKIL